MCKQVNFNFMIESKFQKRQINKLKRAKILNQRILDKICSLKNNDEIQTLVNTYLRYYKSLIQINDRYKKLNIKFDFDGHVRDIDYLNKKVFDANNIHKNALDRPILVKR